MTLAELQKKRHIQAALVETSRQLCHHSNHYITSLDLIKVRWDRYRERRAALVEIDDQIKILTAPI